MVLFIFVWKKVPSIRKKKINPLATSLFFCAKIWTFLNIRQLGGHARFISTYNAPIKVLIQGHVGYMGPISPVSVIISMCNPYGVSIRSTHSPTWESYAMQPRQLGEVCKAKITHNAGMRYSGRRPKVRPPSPIYRPPTQQPTRPPAHPRRSRKRNCCAKSVRSSSATVVCSWASRKDAVIHRFYATELMKPKSSYQPISQHRKTLPFAIG